MIYKELDGVLPVYKESGYTSYDVIREIKKIVGEKQKIGHAGTLDPFARGVLPVVFGRATKAIPFISESEKEYIATIGFGSFTDTDDVTGNVTERFDKLPSLEEIIKILPQFRGKLKQLPPKFSALRVKGKRAYEIARKGGNVELKERIVEVFHIEILNYNEKEGTLKLKILCSSGTYIRSIARDIGKVLSCGGYLKELERTRSCNLQLKDCIRLQGLLLQDIEANLIPVERLIDYPSIEWEGSESYIYEGRNLSFNNVPDGKYKLVKGKKLLAIIEKKNGKFFYQRVFQ
ncbi:MAG: tRNA pseudouridine(55) synthase TruB [Brevinematia bacterium]